MRGIFSFEIIQIHLTVSQISEKCQRIKKNVNLPDDGVFVVDVLGSTAQFADQSFDALIRGNDVGVDVGNAGTKTVNGIWFAVYNWMNTKFKENRK